MRANRSVLGFVVLAVSYPAWGQWESGSDGSDGAFNPPGNVIVDLSLATPGDALTTPGNGNGVYDATRWVVCFKYTSITVPAGATITFAMHPSGAPVVWLATGDVTINGRVNLDGEDGVATNPPIIPYFTRPGPGGFEGAQADHSGSIAKSFGLGPGSSPTNPGNVLGAGASHANVPINDCSTGTGLTYGNASSALLLGGSGGNEDPDELSGAGGAGGGAILIAAPVRITLGAAGSVTAQGGDGNPPPGAGGGSASGGGSGGAIRLRAETVSLATGSQLIGRGGLGKHVFGCWQDGGDGWVRIEAATLVNSGTINGSQSFPGAPSVVFPTAPAQLYVTSACGETAPADPMWSIKTADIDLNSASECVVNIEGTGMPVGTTVLVRIIPARGNIISANSTPMVDAGGGLRTATANVTFPGGRSELQLRANW